MMFPFEPKYLPGHSPNSRPRVKKRKCLFEKGSKEKAKWRAALRKWKRRKKRKLRNSRKSESKSSTKSTLSSVDQGKNEMRKKIKKRKKLRTKKVQMRKHRLKRHLIASKTRKTLVKNKVKWTKEEILNRLEELKEIKLDMMHKFQKYRGLNCSPRRKAIRHLKNAWKRARHQRKKYRRYRRMMQRVARKKKLTVWRNKHLPKPPKQPRVLFDPKTVPKEVSKRVEYQLQFPIKATLNAVELPSEEKHIKEKEKVMLGALPVVCKTPVVGNYGKVTARIYHINKEHNVVIDLRYQVQLTHDKTGSKEAKILARLAMIESPNTSRIIQYGQYQNLQYVLTPQLFTNLAEVLDDHPKMELNACVHIIHQTFLCVKDLHKIGYSHLQINPSAFSVLKSNTQLIVFNNFQFALTRESIRNKSVWLDEETKHRGITKPRLPKNPIEPYMSRGQHFRLVKGTSDDYESWFYLCVRVLSKKPLAWEKETDHLKMVMMKYKFVKEYSHPDPFTNYKMKTIHKYCLSANDHNTLKIGYFVERVLQDWKERNPINGFLPWQRKQEEEEKMKEVKKWMKKNKKWRKPLTTNTCVY
ncbi:unnamed protein product [Caenorhabditis brenneri]